MPYKSVLGVCPVEFIDMILVSLWRHENTVFWLDEDNIQGKLHSYNINLRKVQGVLGPKQFN